MLFNSYVLIFLFLPITVFGYFMFNKLRNNNFAKVWLVLCSFFFYAYFNFSYFWIILSSIVVNYVLSLLMMKTFKEKKLLKRILLSLGLFLNIGVLFFYKYLDFVFECVSNIFNTDPVYMGLILPLGISFFTFQQVSYLVDSYKGNSKIYNVIDYSLFVTFFHN